MYGLIKKVVNIFGLGRMPENLKAQLAAESEVLFLAEGVPVTAIFTDFKSSGNYCGYRRMSFIGYLALSERRIITYAKCWHKIDVNITYDDPNFKTIAFRINKNVLFMKFESSCFIPEASGQIEVRLHIPHVADKVRILKDKGACVIS